MMRAATIGNLAAFLLSFFIATPPGWGFELLTHRDIARESFSRSRVADVFREDLAVDPLRRLSGGFLRGSRVPVDWVVKGALDEDDVLSINPLRFRNHFYDPVNNRGLNARGILGEAAPDWALEDREEFATQAFSYRDARRAFLTSLTAPSRREREEALATTLETLGHVIHLIQDMGSPPHTRNDIHGGFIFGPKSLYELHLNQEEVLRRLNFAGEPVRLSLPREYWVTGDGRGLAEFTNRNFVSDGTNFTARADGAMGGRYPSPVLHLGADEQGRPFETTLDIQAQLEPGLRDRSGNLIQGSVTFFASNSQDPIDGVPLRNERMTTLSLFDRELERKGAALLFTLNRYNIEAQAAFLVPRAVGYSAGLLDHFFRGKLDVDLVPADPNDPSVVRVSGANASTDALQGGTLTLYADDPTDPTGKRDQATALDQDLTVTAAGGAPVESARFQVPENAERFMVVYKGTLGLEKQEGTFLGGVIGKVLGGVRVEEVFSDGTHWKLRTPKGVFLLQGLTAAEFEEVRWGDGDNLLVARTPFGRPDPNQPNLNRVAVYEVQRVPGSVEVETVTTPDGPEVQIREINAVDFPSGMPLGTAVEFSHTIQYRQQLARIDLHRILFQWVPRFPFRPQDGTYEFAGEELGTLTLETAIEEDVRFSGSFPVALDMERSGSFGTLDRPYVWYLQEVAVDASGRLLGVVVVYLTSPQSPGTSLPYFGVNQQGAREVISQVSFTPSFPSQVNPLLWAVVDLKARAVLASTADRVITLTSRVVSDVLPDAYVHGSLEFLGGPTPSVQEIPWNRSGFGLVDPSRPTVVDAELETQAGALAIGVTGWLKGELAPLGVFDFQLGTLQRADQFTYDCGADATLNFFCGAVRVTGSTGVVTRGPAQLRDARRSRPAPGDERLVFIKVGPEGEGLQDTVLVWDPSTRSARMVHRLPAEAESGHFLGPATGATVMVFARGRDSFLIPLDGSQPPAFFPVDLSSSFAVLDPSYLYHVGDLKFYRPRPPLQPTALPARLADVPGNPVGDYHAIRLP